MNDDLREEITDSVKIEGATQSLAQSISVMKNAVKGLNGIKQQWAGITKEFP